MAPEHLAAKKELSKKLNTLPTLYVKEKCDTLCMSKYGLAGRHELLEHMSNDENSNEILSPSQINPHWFLEKVFVPADATKNLRVLPPVTKKKLFISACRLRKRLLPKSRRNVASAGSMVTIRTNAQNELVQQKTSLPFAKSAEAI